ncbi:GntR family transcriptional regulator [Tumebacillus sp. ITR2]|uniref:GntR family transcriptional regulator n=1 Tax=Tumebacillus amylolyticus TaxID=2801339 RepID=A0ABS1JEA5_9BACL|nr:GntR family transcriptional regulator [Tumebacillus amylolyticus]MBL0388615.1 GntR family transcriptional regulator [Tumebacillus amylolyticus]
MLNKHIPIPLYYQLKEKLSAAILSGELPPGALLPSERELSDHYSISRMTVRQALGEMVKEGLLVREQGKGTFVAEPKFNQGLLKLTSFSEDMRNRGLKPDSKILAIYVQDATPAVAAELRLEAVGINQQVIVFERVRLADNKPMAYEISHLPLHRFPELEQESLHSTSLYNLLEEKYGLVIRYARQTMEVGLSRPAESDILGIPAGSAVLKIERTTFDADDEPIEYVKSVYRGDRYKLYAELHR